MQATSGIKPSTSNFFDRLGRERAATFLASIEHLPVYLQMVKVQEQLTIYDKLMPEIYTVAINQLYLRLQQLEFRHNIERLNQIKAMTQRTILPS